MKFEASLILRNTLNFFDYCICTSGSYLPPHRPSLLQTAISRCALRYSYSGGWAAQETWDENRSSVHNPHKLQPAMCSLNMRENRIWHNMFQRAKYTEQLVFNHLRISIIIQCYKSKYCWVKAAWTVRRQWNLGRCKHRPGEHAQNTFWNSSPIHEN